MKLSDFPPNVQARIRAQLDHHPRPVPSAVAQPLHQRQTPRPHPPQARGSSRLVVSLIALRRRTLDDDNCISSFKQLRDSIAASLGLDDGDKRLTWQYQQLSSKGNDAVIVRIEVL